MIINGNYVYPDFNKMIPNLIETFVNYYGEEHRKYITDKLHSVDVHFFTGQGSIVDYVSKKYGKIRDSLVEKYLDDLKVKGNKRNKIRKALFGMSGEPISKYVIGDYSRLTLACLTTRKDFKKIFSKKDQIRYLRYRRDICVALGLTKFDSSYIDKVLCELESKRVEYYSKLQKALGEVGKDEFSIEDKEKEALHSLYKFASKYIKINPNDLKKLSLHNNDVNETVSFKDVFCGLGDISSQGLIIDFGSDAELELSDPNSEVKDMIYKGRINYFNKLGFTLDRKKGESLKSLYNRYLLSGASKFVIPTSIADKIEKKRQELCSHICDNTTFVKYFNFVNNRYINKLSLDRTFTDLPNNYELNFVKRNGVIKERGVVSLDCDICVDEESMIRNLIHELNHHLHVHVSDVDKSKGTYKCKESVTPVETYGLFEESLIPVIFSESPKIEEGDGLTFDMIVEYFNEKMSDELADYYLKHYGNPFISSDVHTDKYPYHSQYIKADYFILDVWNKFKEEIKKECISGKEGFGKNFGYRRLHDLDKLIKEFFLTNENVDEDFCNYIYEGASIDNIPPKVRVVLDRFLDRFNKVRNNDYGSM